MRVPGQPGPWNKYRTAISVMGTGCMLDLKNLNAAPWRPWPSNTPKTLKRPDARGCYDSGRVIAKRRQSITKWRQSWRGARCARHAPVLPLRLVTTSLRCTLIRSTWVESYRFGHGHTTGVSLRWTSYRFSPFPSHDISQMSRRAQGDSTAGLDGKTWTTEAGGGCC